MRGEYEEDAQEELMDAQNALQMLNYELKSILKNKNTQLQYRSLSYVTDMWFDSRFMDCLVHSQISRVQRKISKAIRQVESIRRELVSLYHSG